MRSGHFFDGVFGGGNGSTAWDALKAECIPVDVWATKLNGLAAWLEARDLRVDPLMPSRLRGC